MLMAKVVVDTKKYLEIVNDQIRQIQEGLSALKESATPVSPDNALGRLTRLELMQAQKIAESNYKSSLARLSRLLRAKDLLENNPSEFGICTQCESEINPKRLERYPDSLCCVRCAS